MRVIFFGICLSILLTSALLTPATASSTTKRRMVCEPGEVLVGMTKGKKVLCKGLLDVLQEAIAKEAKRDQASSLNPPASQWVAAYKHRHSPKRIGTSGHSAVPAHHCIKATGDNTFLLDRSKCPKIASSLPNLSSQARLIPHHRNGSTQGWKIVGVRPNSLWRRLGIKSGDVLLKIDGSKFESADQVLAMLGKFKTAKTMTIKILRRGQSIELKYTLMGPAVP